MNARTRLRETGPVFGSGPTWQLYPATVPVGDRVRCDEARCERPGEIVEIRSSLLGSAITGAAASTTAWCLEHATAHGYHPPAGTSSPAALRNPLQRLVVRLLEHRGGGTAR
jgi:hypothetical protein